MTSNQNFKNKVILMMNYDSSKTLGENIEKIKEQSSVIGAPAYVNRETSQDREDREREKAEKIKRTYPNYCKYPKMAVKGFENLIPNYCYYQSPSEYSRERKIVGLWLPYDAEVRFWDIPTLNSFVEQTWNNWHNSGKIKGMTKNELIKNFSEILPVDTVRGFDFSGQTYRTVIVFDKKEFQENKKWMFKGYFRKGDDLEYEEPVWVDTRTDYQKFIDNWGTTLQWSAVVLTIILGAFTEGAGWALTAEILTEMGLGIAVGQRELEKGENVSAVFSFITGALPMLKLTNWFKGVNPALFDELAQDIAGSVIRSEDEMLTFYNSLSPEKQKLFEKIFLQDEVSEDLMKEVVRNLRTVENLNIPPYISTDEMFKLVKSTISNNKGVFKNLVFWDKLWARELTSNLAVGVLDIVVDATLGKHLNNQEKLAIEWAYSKIPDSHKKEFIYNLANNPEAIASITEYIDSTRNKTISSAETYFSTIAKHEIEKNGGKYVELPEDPSKAGESIPDNELEKKKLIKNGWVPQNELNGRGFSDAKFVGDELFFKVKTELSKTDNEKIKNTSVSTDTTQQNNIQ